MAAAFAVGAGTHSVIDTISVILASIPLEVLIGAAVSVALGFDPISGALVAALANLAPAPLLITSIEALGKRWNWLQKRFEKADRIGAKYGKYGVWGLVFLTPIIGVYVGVAVGASLRFKPSLVMASLSLGVLALAFLATLGGGVAVEWAQP